MSKDQIELRLLGIPRLEIAGQETSLPYQKAMALLAYLAVTGQTHSRVALTSLLWGEVDDHRARNSLRNALSVIRRLPVPTPILETDRDQVRLLTDRFWLDVTLFKQALQPKQPIAELTEALALWRGPFLDGFSLEGAVGFDDWLSATRYQLDRLHQDGWLALSRAFEAADQWTQAVEATQQLLILDPLREAGHQQLMRLYLKHGDRSLALQQYERCRQLLAEELGVSPSSQTQALHTQALADQPSTQPVVSYPALAIPEESRAEVAFVGRQRELAALSRHLQEVISSQQGRFVLVEGEAGVGKTRLVQEWLRQEHNAFVLVGRCFEAELSVPYHPWIDLLRASMARIEWDRLGLPTLWLTELARLVPELRVHYPDLPQTTLPDPELVRGRIAEAVRQWLQALARQRPLCLFLDDLQWIDHASLALLEYVLRHSLNLSLLMLGAQREAESTAPWQRFQLMLTRAGLGHRLGLYRLTSPDVTSIAHNMGFGPTISDAFLKRLFRETEGNPLFVVEILRTLRRLETDPMGEWPIPSTIQDVIRSRLDRLPPRTYRLLGVAAVMGHTFDDETLQAVTGQPVEVLLTAMDEGLAAGLLQEQEGRYDFTHDKIRAVLYLDLSAPRRRHLHSRVAEALETLYADNLTSYFGVLAHHFIAGGDSSRARDYAIQAARQAVELYADEDALKWYETAETLFKEVETELPPDEILKVTPFQQNHVSPTLPLDVLGLIYRQRGLIRQRIGQYDEAEASFRVALDRAQARQRLDEQAAVHNLLSFLAYLRSDYDGVGHYAQQALDLATRAGEIALRAPGLRHLGIAIYRTGDYCRARNLYDEALAAYRQAGDRLGMAGVYNNIGFVLRTQAHYAEAIDAFQQALAIYEDLGQVEGIALIHSNIGRTFAFSGDLDQAQHYLKRGLALSEETHTDWITVKIHRTLSNVFAQNEQWGPALTYARQAHTLAKNLGSDEDLGATLRMLAEIAHAWPASDLGDPAPYFEQSIALLQQVGAQDELERAKAAFAAYQASA